jgi:hypothetical protein
MMGFNSRHLAIVGVVGVVAVLFAAAWMFRYEANPSDNKHHFYKLNRWTGP